jgi:hypothetical protein
MKVLSTVVALAVGAVKAPVTKAATTIVIAVNRAVTRWTDA